MSDGRDEVDARVRALRAAFDRSFAEAPRAADPDGEDLLAVRVGGDPHAILLSEVAAIHVDRRVVPIASAAPELLGLVALRGGLAPVYDLRALLGYPAGDAPRWLVVARGAEALALAFDGLDGLLRVARGEVASPRAGDPARAYLRGAVRDGPLARPVVHVASVIEAIARRAAPVGAGMKG